jgi:tetratricopeptide (TPR) repeat protein
MCFGGITYASPKWLRELGRSGIQVEASMYRSYGDDFLKQGNYGMAIAQYQQALKIEPDSVSVLLNLALTWIKAGETETGARILNDVLRRETSKGAREFIYFNLGELAEAEGKTDEAVEYYQQAIGFTIEQAQVYRKLGSLYFGAGQHEKARAAFEKALASQLDLSLPYWCVLQRNLDSFKYDAKNLVVTEKRLSRDIQLPIIEEQLRKGISDKDLTGYDLQIIRDIHQSDPEIAETHSQLAFVYSQMGNISEAIKHMEKSLEIVPDSVGAKKNLEMLQQMQQRSEQGAAGGP